MTQIKEAISLLEASKQALEAFENAGQGKSDVANNLRQSIATEESSSIYDALATQMSASEVEPVAKYIGECSEGSLVQLYEDVKKGTNFYTHPQPKAGETK